MRFPPLNMDADQALPFRPVIGHPGFRVQRAGQVPVALGAHASPDRGAYPRPQGP